jgi:trehalose/maltose hydrolase-like predicted phosphorylase
MHLLITQFECTNEGDAAVKVELTEPGPSMIPLRGLNYSLRGQFAKAAPMGEVNSESVSSGMDGVECNRIEVKVAEKENGTRAVVGECHTSCDKRTFSVLPGTTRVLSCISARHSSIDQDAATGSEPLALARSTWQRANESASTLWDTHVASQKKLFAPGIEVEGNTELARVINVTVEALLAAYRHDAFPGAGSGGLAADAYAGATDWDEEIW